MNTRQKIIQRLPNVSFLFQQKTQMVPRVTNLKQLQSWERPPPKFDSIYTHDIVALCNRKIWYYSLLTRVRVASAPRCWSRWRPVLRRLGPVDKRRRLCGPTRNRRYYLRCRNVVDLIDSALTRPVRWTDSSRLGDHPGSSGLAFPVRPGRSGALRWL